MVKNRQFEELAIERIQKQGYRITSTRIQILRILSAAKSAMTAYQVFEAVKESGQRMDVVSIYRILDFLHKLDLIFKIGIEPGYFPKKLALENDMETFVLFDSETKMVYEVPLPNETVSQIASTAKESGFTLERLVVEGVVKR